MSGYIMNLGTIEQRAGREKLELYCRYGAYGTLIERPSEDSWHHTRERILADYVTVRPGALVFFFLGRNIYGVGRVVGFDVEEQQLAALSNYPGASFPHATTPQNPDDYLWRENGEENLRWVIFFEPHPYFFKTGLDMDEVLASDVKGVVRSLRIFERVSFIQMEDEETQVILDLLLRRNEDILNGYPFPDQVFDSRAEQIHTRVREHDLTRYQIDLDGLIRKHAKRDGSVGHEALVHAWLTNALTQRQEQAVRIFGNWDYVTNQYPASPQKPVQFMDRIDIFGYVEKRISQEASPTVVRYKIVEIKKGKVATEEGINQLIKYVDWVAHTRAGGDYSLVDAYFVAHDYADDVVQYVQSTLPKDFVTPRRPYAPAQWKQLELIRYTYTGGTPALELQRHYPSEVKEQ
ncbi:MAG: hypothetical protein ACE5NP_00460 [Anaerolineae bacterium]